MKSAEEAAYPWGGLYKRILWCAAGRWRTPGKH